MSIKHPDTDEEVLKSRSTDYLVNTLVGLNFIKDSYQIAHIRHELNRRTKEAEFKEEIQADKVPMEIFRTSHLVNEATKRENFSLSMISYKIIDKELKKNTVYLSVYDTETLMTELNNRLSSKETEKLDEIEISKEDEYIKAQRLSKEILKIVDKGIIKGALIGRDLNVNITGPLTQMFIFGSDINCYSNNNYQFTMLPSENIEKILYDERHEKYEKEQEEKKVDFEYYASQLKKNFDKSPFEFVEKYYDTYEYSITPTYFYNIKYNNLTLCTCIYYVKINKWKVLSSNTSDHIDPKDLIERVKKVIDDYLERKLKAIDNEVKKSIQEQTLLATAKYHLKY